MTSLIVLKKFSKINWLIKTLSFIAYYSLSFSLSIYLIVITIFDSRLHLLLYSKPFYNVDSFYYFKIDINLRFYPPPLLGSSLLHLNSSEHRFLSPTLQMDTQSRVSHFTGNFRTVTNERYWSYLFISFLHDRFHYSGICNGW